MLTGAKKDAAVHNGNGNLQIGVLADANAVWLDWQQLARMFGRDVKAIGKHIAHALKEELKGFPVVSAADGKTHQHFCIN